jgi:hypothetical protein
MEFKPGSKVRHKLTGEEVLVMEVGPKSRNVFVPPHGNISQEYLSESMVRVRLKNMEFRDVYDYEIDGISYEETGSNVKGLLMEKS